MKLFFTFILAMAIGPKALAFPEMVRHGYVHCTACHTNLAGGGLLNDYGRALSRELLSQLKIAGKESPEGDEQFLYQTVPRPDWLLLGGDIRVLQTFSESRTTSRGRFFIMQADLDASAQIGKRWRVFGSVGRMEPRVSDPTFKDFIISPRHGIEILLNKPDQLERWTLRMGRFIPAFGIGFAEHTFVTRRLFNLMPGQERYAAGLAWVNERYSVIGTGIFSQAVAEKVENEQGGILQVASAVGKNSKVGVNFYRSQKFAGQAAEVLGVYGHFDFGHDWYGLFEVDRSKSGVGKIGLVEIAKVGREVIQGFHVVGVQEFANLDMDHANPKFEAYSLGLQWFPRPHWDFYGLYRKERNTLESNEFKDVVWLLGHFYL